MLPHEAWVEIAVTLLFGDQLGFLLPLPVFLTVQWQSKVMGYLIVTSSQPSPVSGGLGELQVKRGD
jgi:hypothetical protein